MSLIEKKYHRQCFINNEWVEYDAMCHDREYYKHSANFEYLGHSTLYMVNGEVWGDFAKDAKGESIIYEPVPNEKIYHFFKYAQSNRHKQISANSKVLNDANLSWGAKGLFVSLVDDAGSIDAKFNEIKPSTDSEKMAIASFYKELVDAGYIKKDN